MFSSVLHFWMLGCTAPDKLLGDSNVFADTNIDDTNIAGDTSDTDSAEEPDDIIQASSVDDVLSGGADVGDEVSLTGLVVTSPSNDNGFYVGDPEGGSNSGIWVQADVSNKGIVDVQVGQQIDIVGTYTEPEDTSSNQEGHDTSESTLVITSLEQLVIHDELPLVAIVASETNTEAMDDPATAESYEGVLVKIAYPQLVVSNNILYLNGTLPVGDRLLPIDVTQVDESLVLEWVYGIISYSEGQYWFNPRSEDDIVRANTTLADVTGDMLFISELFASSTPPINCIPDLNWYLELTYIPNNEQSLVADTLYIVRTPATGGIEISKVSPASGVIDKYSSGIVSDVGTTTCLGDYNADGPVLQYPTETVGIFSPISDLAAGDYIQLIHAPTYDDLSMGTYTVIDTLTIGTDFVEDSSRELQSSYTGNGSNDTNDLNAWCNSTRNLIDSTGDVLVNQAIVYFGSPGGYDVHCY